MALCIAAGATSVAIATQLFVLTWSHSVEHIEWREEWRVGEGGLSIVEASVRGTGAGMEIPPGAELRDGAWHYVPDLGPQPRLSLADAGRETDWFICVDGNCAGLRDLVDSRGRSTTLSACADDGRPFSSVIHEKGSAR